MVSISSFIGVSRVTDQDIRTTVNELDEHVRDTFGAASEGERVREQVREDCVERLSKEGLRSKD